MQPDPRAVLIYTDGSCYQQKGRISGCAAIVVYPDHLSLPNVQILDFGCAESKNNRMELLACIRALEWVRANKPWAGVSRVQIITDSQYITKYINLAHTWKKNGWRNQHGEPRENWDLWNQLLSALSKAGIRVTFHWAPGKTTPLLKAVDKAAKRAAKRGGPEVDRGFRPGIVARSMVEGAASRFPARGQTATIRIYRKDVMAKGENKVRFDVFVGQAYVESCYAYATPEIAAALHRQHGYEVRFNDNPNYPQIIEILAEVSLPPRPALVNACGAGSS